MSHNFPKLWIFFFLITLVLVVTIIATAPSTPEVIETQTEAPEPTRYATYEEMLERGDDAVYIENQQSGLESVLVGFVVLAKPGFVVIYNDNGGIPGSIIGKSDILSSSGENVVIPIDESLVDDQVYYAIMYHDDGDGYFGAEEDTQAVDSQQSVVLMTFLATLQSQLESGFVDP